MDASDDPARVQDDGWMGGALTDPRADARRGGAGREQMVRDGDGRAAGAQEAAARVRLRGYAEGRVILFVR